MDMKQNYTKINLDEWNRGKLFKSYIDNMRIVMSLTVDVDVTKLIKFTKNNGLKFYPTMIWILYLYPVSSTTKIYFADYFFCCPCGAWFCGLPAG